MKLLKKLVFVILSIFSIFSIVYFLSNKTNASSHIDEELVFANGYKLPSTLQQKKVCGNVISIEIHSWAKLGQSSSKPYAYSEISKFNGKGNIVSKSSYNDEKFIYNNKEHKIVKLDGKRKIVKIFNSKAKIEEKQVHSDVNLGSVLQNSIIYPSTLITTFYTYDSRNNLTLRVRRNRNGKILDQFQYIYNHENQITKEIRNYKKDFGKEVIQEFYYSYGNDGKLIRRTKLLESKEPPYTYDNNGNLTFHNGIEYKYEYDEKGNWIQKIGYRNGQLVQKISRTISYKKE